MFVVPEPAGLGVEPTELLDDVFNDLVGCGDKVEFTFVVV